MPQPANRKSKRRPEPSPPAEPQAVAIADDPALDRASDEAAETFGDGLAPRRSLEMIREDPEATDDLLASLANEAIDQMLAADTPRRKRKPRREEEADPFAADLTPDEQAALADDLDLPQAEDEADDEGLPVMEPPPEHPVNVHGREDELITTMPTDEELDALLRAEIEEPPEPARQRPDPVGRQAEPNRDAAGDALTAAAAAVAAELDAELADDDDDLDAIQAEGAIEARIGVNRTEPPVEFPELEDAFEEEEIPILASPAPAPAEAVAEAEPRQSWWVRCLVRLNGPMTDAPDTLRDMLGKVAVITLLNATAVIVYVLVIRR